MPCISASLYKFYIIFLSIAMKERKGAEMKEDLEINSIIHPVDE